MTLTHDIKLEHVCAVLQKEPADRTLRELAILQTYLSTNAFIATQVEKLREDADSLSGLFKSLKYEDCDSGKAVFEYGQSGSTFYVILAGAVEIRVPMPVELEGSSATPEGLLIFLITYFESICWEKLHNGLAIKKELAEQLRQLGLSVKSKDKSELLLLLGRCIVKKTTDVHLRIHKLFEMRNESIKLHWSKTVQTLGPGESFGERALEKHEARAGTAHCSNDCIFATLYRNNYNRIIGQAHKREVRAMNDYLRQFRILSQLRASVLERIQYYLQPRTFTLGQTLFKEGVSKVDGIYLIKKGDFEITVSSHSTTLASTPRSSQQPEHSTLGQLCRSKSSGLLRSLQREPELRLPLKELRLYVVSQFEVVGLEEIIDNSMLRKSTATCVSQQGWCHFIAIDQFCDFVNQNKFSQQILQEQICKHVHTQERIRQTHQFQRALAQEQQLSQQWAHNQRLVQEQVQLPHFRESPAMRKFGTALMRINKSNSSRQLAHTPTKAQTSQLPSRTNQQINTERKSVDTKSLPLDQRTTQLASWGAKVNLEPGQQQYALPLKS